MSDLLQSAQLFEVSSRLQTASTYLQKMVDGEGPGPAGEDALKWAGAFLTQVDWASKIKPAEGAREGLAVQATSARPSFYRVITKLFPVFEHNGITTSEDVSAFLGDVYTTLVGGGTVTEGLVPERLRIAATLLELLSQSVLSQLSDDSVPEQPPLVAGSVS